MGPQSQESAVGTLGIKCILNRYFNIESYSRYAMLTLKSKSRRAIDRYLWNETKGMYFDYDTVKREQTNYETATTFVSHVF